MRIVLVMAGFLGFFFAAPSMVLAKTITAHYDVYAGGLSALQAALRINQSKSTYAVRLETHTQGFLGGLFPWRGAYATEGAANAVGRWIPRAHESTTYWRDKQSLHKLSYDAHGKLLRVTAKDGASNPVSRPFDPVLAAGAVDLLTGVVRAFQGEPRSGSVCHGTIAVFDGRRRINVTLRNMGRDDLKPSRYSRFSGAATKCALKVAPMGGFSAKDKKRGWMAVQAHAEAYGRPPMLWLARVDGMVLPVRVEIASAYGTVVAHLSRNGLK